ncbi:uncharacterized protein NECHADRAFT_91012 [Fusarium vanettenii 77-13-4]|uniref:DUF202 domain-containing protein n=1 Tax=Fusarium vanettenii (strain ATCC MYA-4622 / CBS 123669 / FGSC 9596 / NRRL 45880 / 77-13-4) TaxID=660122 RepID=C7Z7F9_FUSV7|nr:uncharacterized protein NECHADRAFT_91012 [Fusarium vanettenii 77-13-4]EEU40864.1 predicted protein [Fusarium vanettenii 77-13-4]
MASRQSDGIDDEDLTVHACCAPLENFTRPVNVNEISEEERRPFFHWPYFGPLLVENESTFLSYLRLSIYMAIVSVAITLSFHLKTEATPLELRMAKPLGTIFWALSVMTLFAGMGNYITTVNKYSRRAAIVQIGWKTHAIFSITAVAIIGTCLILLVIAKIRNSSS